MDFSIKKAIIGVSLALSFGCAHPYQVEPVEKDGSVTPGYGWIPYGKAELSVGDQAEIYAALCRPTTTLHLRHHLSKVCDPGPVQVADVVEVEETRALVRLPAGFNPQRRDIFLERVVKKQTPSP